MEEKIIVLDINAYENLVKVLNSDQQNIHFKCCGEDDIVTIPNTSKSKSNNANNEKNIVEKWMEDIREIAERGYQDTRESNSERHFSKIKAYCKAVIVSVTS